MPDLDSLRAVGGRLQPPPLTSLEEVARQRSRQAAVATSLAGVVTVATVVLGLVLVVQKEDGSLPEPAPTPSVTVTTSETPSPRPSPTARATHRSDTSMTPQEVVLKPNASLLLTGVSADDPDFRMSIWSAPCPWCPNDDEPRGRPRFYGVAITTDGFATATYLRPAWELSGLEHVESPGPGLLLVIDAANGPEWLVRDDGTITRLARVVEERRPADERFWHVCADNYDNDYQVSWCALDPSRNAFYVWEGPWRSTMTSSESMASPGATEDPWGLVWPRPDYYTAPDQVLVAYWYVDGVRQTHDFGRAAVSGVVGNLPPGVMSVWSLDRGSRTMSIFTSPDRGASWQTAKLTVPFFSRFLTVSRTSGGGLVALQEDAFYQDGSRHEGEGIRIWRASSADGGAFTVAYESRFPTDARGAYARRFAILDGRIWSGGLWSDDDGRTWSAIPAWR